MHLQRLFALALFAATPAHAGPSCANTVSALRALVADKEFPLDWSEMSMDDGKPLLLTLLERDGALFLRFVKTGEGLWAEGAVAICMRGDALLARATGPGLRMGPAANWAIRTMLADGAELTLTRQGAARLRVSASGWSGVFASGGPARSAP